MAKRDLHRMRNLIQMAHTIAALMLVVPHAMADDSDVPFRVGYAESDITPPPGLPMWGYGARHALTSKGAIDPLMARVVVIHAGEDKLAIVGTDLGRGPMPSMMEQIRAALKEQAGIERLVRVVRNPYYRTPTRPYTNAGLCYLRLKDDQAAERQFLLAVQTDPSNTLALYHLASLAYQRGAYDVANGYLQNLQQQAVPTAESLLLGARIARKLGNQENEASFATQLRSRFPTSKEYEIYSKEKSR